MSNNTNDYSVAVVNGNNLGTSSKYLNKLPDKCPYCKHGIVPHYCYGKLLSFGSSTALNAIFQCPLDDCKMLFLGLYNESGYGSGIFFLVDSYQLNQFVNFVDFPDVIKNISPRFHIIYNQAKIAEGNKLDELAGIGYGKSLEFLIKDYLIHAYPPRAEKIKKMFLSTAINEMGEKEANIKKCAERAAWLRNDETHYERKWIDKDINDLKTLIHLTVNWIESTLLTEQYEKDMPPKK